MKIVSLISLIALLGAVAAQPGPEASPMALAKANPEASPVTMADANPDPMPVATPHANPGPKPVANPDAKPGGYSKAFSLGQIKDLDDLYESPLHRFTALNGLYGLGGLGYGHLGHFGGFGSPLLSRFGGLRAFLAHNDLDDFDYLDKIIALKKYYAAFAPVYNPYSALSVKHVPVVTPSYTPYSKSYSYSTVKKH